MPRLLMVTTVHETLLAFITPFADHFRAKGWQVDAMARGVAEDSRCRSAFDHVWDVAWSRNPLNPSNLFGTASRIRKIVVDQGYDIVHVHTPVASFVTRFALRGLLAPKVICTVHGFHFHRNGNSIKNSVFRLLEKMAGSWTDRLVIINDEDHEAALQSHIVTPERLIYMPGIGIDPDNYCPGKVTEEEQTVLRREIQIEEGAPIFLVIAEFTKNKRHIDLLKAFALLKEDTKIRLVFAGSGALEETTKQLAEKMGLSTRVCFLGHRSDVPTLLSISTALILASGREGLPRSIMEAMSMGTPVIGADARGTRDLLENNCGLIFPIGDSEALAAAMQWIIEHPDESRRMGVRGQEVVRKKYGLGNVIKLHEEMYHDVLTETETARQQQKREVAEGGRNHVL